MQERMTFLKSLSIISAVGFVLASLVIYIGVNQQKYVYAKTIGYSSSLASSTEVRSDLPVRIRIPRIATDAVIDHVGLTSKGAMDVPKGRDSTAWFKLGPVPGEAGSSVIDGHSGWENGQSAVFDNLHKLKTGDRIYIEDKNGGVTTFAVRESRVYIESQDSREVFGSGDGKAHLNLITCSGDWDSATQSSPDRLVVFADKL